MDPDIAARVRQSADASTSPELLRRLARDPSVTVRASLALNPALPPQVTAMLADDRDERVRLILNRKIASLAPSLPDNTRTAVQQRAVANLTAMVAQAALRVRANVADAVRDLPNGPREIVLRLAHDQEIMVAEPVIRLSPMLSAEDLICLIAGAPTPATITAVARRPAIAEIVSDAVVETADNNAITALLANQTAQIREATLDALAAQSEEHAVWRDPLVRRPKLPVMAQRILADIVTGSLLETLSARPDLDPKVNQQVRRVLETARARSGPDMRPPAALAHAQKLREAGRLDDMALLDALRENALVQAQAMFAVRAGVPAAVLEQAFGLRNAKAIVALAWKAGMSMQTAVVVQAALARLPPDIIIRSGPGGKYPASPEEMQRQLGLLGIADNGPKRWVPRKLSPAAPSSAAPSVAAP